MKNTWLAIIVGGAAVSAQEFKTLQTPTKPLVLKAQGSFFVGGERVARSHAELGSLGPAGHVSLHPMYVRYMIPQRAKGIPLVMIHGATLTGKTWETTPDGRMGWDEYFVRKGHATYTVDQVGRGRSGFDQAPINNGRAPVFRRFSDEGSWPNFRFGPKEGEAHPDEQFPVGAAAELAKQSIPDSNPSLPTPNPSFRALSTLAGQLGRAVLMGHSQGGVFPLEAALTDASGIAGMILIEPGSCPATYTDAQIATLAKIPLLVVFGDHLDTPTGIPQLPLWSGPFTACKAFIARVKAAGGDARMLYPPEMGIRGNSHMIMQDKNNLQIADLILKWVRERVKN